MNFLSILNTYKRWPVYVDVDNALDIAFVARNLHVTTWESPQLCHGEQNCIRPTGPI
jgi:hypothetical protein